MEETQTPMKPLLTARDVSKTYGTGTLALRDVSIDVLPGTVHGLMGENGAGKSTLLKIISGVHRPTAGHLSWQGEQVAWRTPLDAVKAGIGTVHQHIPLASGLSVLENVFLHHGGWRRRNRALRDRYEEIAHRIGYLLDADSIVEDLSIGERQMVAIMQALAADAALVILDEPTASLAQPERERLFAAVRQLAAAGTAFILCSHFIREVTANSDEITVIRDGRVVLHTTAEAADPDELFEKIAGRKLAETEHAPRRHLVQSAPLLEARNITLHHGTIPFDFHVGRGEIVGIAGLMGAGRSSLLRTLFGAHRPDAGVVTFDGKRKIRSIARARAAGIGFLPEDRVADALILDWEIWRNLSLAELSGLSWHRAILRAGSERSLAVDLRDRLRIKADTVEMTIAELSGGNAQKVAIGRTLSPRLSVLLLDEPTVGVDVGAKAEILQAIRAFADDLKIGVVVVSSAFEELLAVSNRIVVMRHGTLTAERAADETSERDLLALVSGFDTTIERSAA
jgi:ribose transport system ATP-binding protein